MMDRRTADRQAIAARLLAGKTNNPERNRASELYIALKYAANM